jgi:rSAM/selenodomain-associated transferase 2
MAISVIIPTLNEAPILGDTIAALRAQSPHEIIVVDGGSTDGTQDAASGATLLISAPRGRACQMNAGSWRATGDILLFLHADCRLGPGALAQAESILRRRGVAAGCFMMRVQARGLLYRWMERVAQARVRFAGIVYGDQGLFLRRELFRKIGGYPPLRLMEDVCLSRRLRRLGHMVVAPAQIDVSPRRWQHAGIVRQAICNWSLLLLAASGVHPDRLASFYPEVRGGLPPPTGD